jgi:hypothetical protein
LLPIAIIDYSEISSVLALSSSIAIVLGALFVVLQIRDNKKLIIASTEQAKAAVIQAKLSTDQLRQNNEIADMDIILRLYEFANTAEFQGSWLTVIASKLGSFEDFKKLPKSDKVAYLQVSALFESIGVLLDRGIVSLATIDDMFLPETAWNAMKPYMEGVKANVAGTGYVFFEKMVKALEENHRQPAGSVPPTDQRPTRRL